MKKIFKDALPGFVIASILGAALMALGGVSPLFGLAVGAFWVIVTYFIGPKIGDPPPAGGTVGTCKNEVNARCYRPEKVNGKSDYSNKGYCRYGFMFKHKCPQYTPSKLGDKNAGPISNRRMKY